MGQIGTLSGLAERFGLTGISQVTIASVTALSLAALGWSIGQTLLQQNDYSSTVSSSQQQTMPDLNLVNQANLFGKIGSTPPPDNSELPSTRLQWVLQGVFTGTAPDNGSAIILAGEQSAQLYKAKQSMPGGAKLTEVHPDHVVINLNGRLETLRFPTIGSMPRVEDAIKPIGEPMMDIAEETASNRREIVRQRLEMLRQRALSRP
jgi:general secretion pathway protein C